MKLKKKQQKSLIEKYNSLLLICMHTTAANFKDIGLEIKNINDKLQQISDKVTDEPLDNEALYKLKSQ